MKKLIIFLSVILFNIGFLKAQNPIKVIKALSTLDTNYLKANAQDDIKDVIGNFALGFNADFGDISSYTEIESRKNSSKSSAYMYKCTNSRGKEFYLMIFYLEPQYINTIYYSADKDYIKQIMDLLVDTDDFITAFFNNLKKDKKTKIEKQLSSGFVTMKDTLFAVFDNQNSYYGKLASYEYYDDILDDSYYDETGFVVYKFIYKVYTDKYKNFYVGLEIIRENGELKLNGYYYAQTPDDIYDYLK